jgi:hypothetical protein
MTLGDTRENIVLRYRIFIVGSLKTILMHFLKKRKLNYIYMPTLIEQGGSLRLKNG